MAMIDITTNSWSFDQKEFHNPTTKNQGILLRHSGVPTVMMSSLKFSFEV